MKQYHIPWKPIYNIHEWFSQFLTMLVSNPFVKLMKRIWNYNVDFVISTLRNQKLTPDYVMAWRSSGATTWHKEASTWYMFYYYCVINIGYVWRLFCIKPSPFYRLLKFNSSQRHHHHLTCLTPSSRCITGLTSFDPVSLIWTLAVLRRWPFQPVTTRTVYSRPSLAIPNPL